MSRVFKLAGTENGEPILEFSAGLDGDGDFTVHVNGVFLLWISAHDGKLWRVASSGVRGLGLSATRAGEIALGGEEPEAPVTDAPEEVPF